MNGRYRFFPENKFDLKPVWEFYQTAFRNWKTIWTEIDYKIPLDHSLWVAAILIAFTYTGSSLSFGSFSLLGLIGAAFAGVIGWLILVGIFTLSISWLGASGDFSQYFAFAVYGAFFQIPISLLTCLAPPLGGLFSLLFFIWMTRGFYLQFRPHLKRFLVLVGVCCLFLMGLMAALFGFALGWIFNFMPQVEPFFRWTPPVGV